MNQNPLPVMGYMNAVEACSAISDTCGNLLFYTNGSAVWNKNHQIMPNGYGLMGHFSSTQGALIVPDPEYTNIYYIFTTDDGESKGINGMRYSVVDISVNGGLGDVTIKNNLLFSPCTEKLAATRHRNGKDVWVVGRKRYSQDFYAYLVSSTGINTTPIITSIGASAYAIGDGYLRFSPDGNKLAAAYHTGNSGTNDTVDVYDFDKTTGIISNTISLVQDFGNELYGVVFSPDNSKLYVSMYNINLGEKQKIFQYDVSSGNPQIIISSKTLIYADDSVMYMSMQLRPDGKIFVARDAFLSIPDINDTLATIHNPNATGLSCNFVKKDFFLNGGSSYVGLPNFVDSYFNNSWQPPCVDGINLENIESNNSIIVYPNPFNTSTTLFLNSYINTNNDNIILEVYDIFGKKIRHIVFPGGNNSLTINRDNIPTGIYFAKISIRDKILTKTIIIN